MKPESGGADTAKEKTAKLDAESNDLANTGRDTQSEDNTQTDIGDRAEVDARAVVRDSDNEIDDVSNDTNSEQRANQDPISQKQRGGVRPVRSCEACQKPGLQTI